MTAGDIADRLDAKITKPSVSHHFAVLKAADLIHARREGQQIYYGAEHHSGAGPARPGLGPVPRDRRPAGTRGSPIINHRLSFWLSAAARSKNGIQNLCFKRRNSFNIEDVQLGTNEPRKETKEEKAAPFVVDIPKASQPLLPAGVAEKPFNLSDELAALKTADIGLSLGLDMAPHHSTIAHNLAALPEVFDANDLTESDDEADEEVSKFLSLESAGVSKKKGETEEEAEERFAKKEEKAEETFFEKHRAILPEVALDFLAARHTNAAAYAQGFSDLCAGFSDAAASKNLVEGKSRKERRRHRTKPYPKFPSTLEGIDKQTHLKCSVGLNGQKVIVIDD